MNFKEMKQSVEILNEEWNLGKEESKATGNICAWIYLMWILGESEQIVIYKENNELIGFAGYSKENSNKYLLRKKLYHFIEKILYSSRKIKNKEALEEYYNNFEYLPNKLKKYFDGQLTILIVNKKYREKQIGKKLLLEIFDLAKKDNMKNIQISSDESCNYKIYEKIGCNKVYETIIKNKECKKAGNTPIIKAFVYEKRLQ